MIYFYGHKLEELLELTKVGSELQKESGLPIYQKIINKYKIHKLWENDDIAKKIFDYYLDIGKSIPQYFHLKNIMRNIKMKLQPKYLELQRDRLAREFDMEENNY